jgi:hypothetical protein
MVATKSPTVEELAEELRIDRANFRERIAELELELEDRGWTKLSGGNKKAWTRDALRRISDESFLFRMKNPIIRRAVLTQSNYVFGQGVTVKAVHPVVDEVVQAFMLDKKNQKVFTSAPAMVKAEGDLWITANLFFVLIKNDEGDVRISTIVFDEIEDTVTNPEDKNETWYFLRQWTPKGGVMKKEYYPALDYNPETKDPTYDGKPINWDKPVQHVMVNVVLDQKFGTSEIYAAQDWARAYNKFLADWSTIVRSYARFAYDITKKAGSGGLIAAKNKLDSKISQDQFQPSPATGSAFVHDEATKIAPIRTGGATTAAEDGRRLLLMVCADTGLPETFFGDASVGTLATAQSLNRPTELGFSLRQRMWESVIETMTAYAIQCKADVGYKSDDPEKKGNLTGEWVDDSWGEQTFIYADDTENEDPAKRDQPIDVTVLVDFPPLVEDDMKSHVEAIMTSATLNGHPFAGTLNAEYTTEQLLRALGETSIEEVMEKLFPEGEEPEAQAITGAVQDLQQAIEALSEANQMDRAETVKLLAETFVLAFKEATKEDCDEEGGIRERH